MTEETQTPIALTNPETAQRYAATTHVDQFVDVPGRHPQRCYRGMISEITPEAAERYVRWGGNLIILKPATATYPGSSAPNADENDEA